jgi:hypothetical protein
MGFDLVFLLLPPADGMRLGCGADPTWRQMRGRFTMWAKRLAGSELEKFH